MVSRHEVDACEHASSEWSEVGGGCTRASMVLRISSATDDWTAAGVQGTRVQPKHDSSSQLVDSHTLALKRVPVRCYYTQQVQLER